MMVAVTVTAAMVGGVAVSAAAQAPPPAAPAVEVAEPVSFDPGEPVVWTPGAVDLTPVGGSPDGAWEPTAAQEDSGAGATSAAPSALAAAGDPAGSFAGSGAAGANLGIQPFYGVETFALAPGLTATVNLATGNLVLRSEDVAFNAPGISLRLDSFHNSRASGAGALGPGAVFSTGHDVGLKVEPTRVTFYGPSGFTAAFTANGTGGWTAPAGINADLVRGGDGTWSLTYRRTGEKLTFTAGGYLVKDVDRNGVGLTLAYNAENKLASITDGAGRVTTFSYQSDGHISHVIDPTGRDLDYDYDTAGAVDEVHYPDGTVLGFTAAANGRVDRLTTREGNVVALSYDSAGRATKVEQFLTPGAATGDAVTTTFAYPSTTSTTQTNPLGGTSTYTFDSAGRVTKVIDPLGHTRSASWTPNSDIATATDAMGTGGVGGNVIRYEYDTRNNRTAVTLPTGAATRAVYAQGPDCATTDTGHPYQAKCTRDDAGRTRSLAYDTPGNLTSVTDTTPGGGAAKQTFTYQAIGTGGTQCGGKPGQICTATDARGKTTRYTYDTTGNLTKVTPPAPLGPTSYGYDAASRLTSVTDALGQTTTYTYDARDRLTSTTYHSGEKVTNFYDDDGNLITSIDTTQGTSTYTYDTLGRETARTQPGMSGDFDTAYDKAGNVTAVDDPEGNYLYAYNTANQLTEATEPGGHVTTFGYDANGNETRRTLPNTVVQTTTRDASGRATRIRAVNGAGTVLSDLAYTYTAPGTTGTAGDRTFVQTRTDHRGVAAPAGAITTYGYDSLARLTTATEKTATGAANAAWAYAYDPAGNRTSQTLTGGTGPGRTPASPAATTTWAYNDANQITARNGSTTGWAFDANGNQTSSPTWGTARYDDRSAAAEITTAGVTTEFEYLGDGNTTRLEAGPTDFTHGTLGLATATTGTDPATIYRRTPDGSILSTDADNAPRRYFLTDNLGSVVAITSDTGDLVASYAYDPYGNTRAATGPDAAANPIRYTGGHLDHATGLYKLGARYYDPTTARFTQMDPTAQEQNPYAYAKANPCNYTDVTGTSALLCAVGVVGVGLNLAGDVAGVITLGSAFLAGSGLGIAVGIAGMAFGLVLGIIVSEWTIDQCTS